MKILDESVGGVAHDLNNQIMILLNALDRIALLCPNLPEAAIALRSAEKCAALASQLLPKPKNSPSARPKLAK